MSRVCTALVCFSLFLSALLCTRPALAAPRKKKGRVEEFEAPRPVASTTRLRAKTPVVLYVSRQGQTQIEHLNVEVVNVGEAIGVDVEVFAEWGGGMAYVLKGAKRLEVGQHGLYTLGARGLVLGFGAPRLVVRCANCKR